MTLTPVGRSALKSVMREASATHEEVLAPLDPAERDLLHDLLLRILTRLDPLVGDAPPDATP